MTLGCCPLCVCVRARVSPVQFLRQRAWVDRVVVCLVVGVVGWFCSLLLPCCLFVLFVSSSCCVLFCLLLCLLSCLLVFVVAVVLLLLLVDLGVQRVCRRFLCRG